MTQKKWTKQKIKRRLKEESKKVEGPLVSGDVPPKLKHAAYSYFGSWNRAKKAAGLGLAQASPKEWDREDVKDKLKEWDRKVEGVLSQEDVPSVLAKAAHDLFGSWNEAKEAVGLKLHKKKWTEGKVKEKLRELAPKTGEHLHEDDVPKSLSGAAEMLFGTWNEAKRAAGLEVVEPVYKKWTEDKVKRELKNRASETEGYLSSSDVSNGLRNAALRYFRTWNQAKKAAGLMTYEEYKEKKSKQDLEEEVL